MFTANFKKMKTGIIIISAILLLFQTGISQNVIHVNALKFNELLKAGSGITLDVRTPEEYSRGHIANSTLINLEDPDVVKKIALLPKVKPIYLYCLTGSRSRYLADYMVQNGFNQVYNLQRGLIDWQYNNFPLQQGVTAAVSKSKSFSTADFTAMLSSNQLVFIDFYAVWCAPCRTMSPIVDKLSEKYKQKVKIEKIDIEANRDLAKSLDVQSIPGFILFKNGQKIWAGTGVMSYDELEKIVEKHL
jgi:thioredoxin 1